MMNHFLDLVTLLRMRAEQEEQKPAYTFLLNGELPEAQWTYAELDRRARRIGAVLQQHNAAGERVLLLYPPGMDFISAFLGCLYAGAVAVPAYPPRNKRHISRIQTIVDDAQARFLLTVTKSQERIESWLNVHSSLQSIHFVATDTLITGLEDNWAPPNITRHDLAFLQYTSGSTALPKGVMVSHDNLWHNLKLIQKNFEHTPESLGVIWLPPYHDMGLIGGILQPLFVGFPVVLMSPVAFLQRPIRWLKAISDYQATTSGGPNFAYDLCVEKISCEARDDIDLKSWDIAFSGAEPVCPETLQSFTEKFAACGFRKNVFYPCYGLAESTLLVSGGQKGSVPILRTLTTDSRKRTFISNVVTNKENERIVVSCGQNLSGQRICIVDPKYCVPCPPGEEGEIWLSGPCVSLGYWDHLNLTETNFRAYLAGNEDGPFLRTGDLGILDNGELYVTGRLKDLIIIRGRNHYPQDIERTVERCDSAIRRNSSAVFSVFEDGEEKLVIVSEIERRFRERRHISSDKPYKRVEIQERRRRIERRQSMNPTPTEVPFGFTQEEHEAFDPERIMANIRQAVAEEHDLQTHAVVLLKFGTIPRTSSGKIQRHACKVGFLNESLEVQASNMWEQSPAEEHVVLSLRRDSLLRMPLEERKTKLTRYLQQLIANIMKRSLRDIQTRKSFSALGLDSMQAVELQYQLEELLGIEVPMTTFLQDARIEELAHYYAASLSADSKDELCLPTIDREVDEYDLSFNQKALWFLYQLAPDSAAYHVSFAVRIFSGLHVGIFRQAFQFLIDRHPVLRTTYIVHDGQPTQCVQPETTRLALECIDISSWKADAIQDYLRSETHKPFDLERGPVLRMNLLTRSATEHILLLTAHHIAVDLWSLLIVMDEFQHVYPAMYKGSQAQLPSLPHCSYLHYTQWQQHMMKTAAHTQEHWTYWQQQLAGELPVLALPEDYPRPPVQTYDGASYEFELSPEMTANLKQMAQSSSGTLFMLLLASFQILLHRCSGQDDLIVGSPTAGRSKAQYEGVVGYFVNPVALRAKFHGDPTFFAFFHQVRQTVLEALEHQEYPFQVLVEKLQPKRDASRSPIFQTMFVLQRPHRLEDLAPFVLKREGARIELGGLLFESFKMEHQTAPFDLELVMIESEQKLAGSFVYNTDLFCPETIHRIAGYFLNLLESIITNPEQQISKLSLLSEVETKQLLSDWNMTQRAYPSDACLHQLIETQATRTPDAIAAVSGKRSITYHELNCRANQLGHYLQKHGVQPEMLVGIYVERSLDLLVGLLGILKAGGAYVPMDPMYPRERLSFMLEDAQAQVLITEQSLVDTFEPGVIHTVCLDSHWGIISQESRENPDCRARPDNLAYVIYTSGSTGKPKGVQISHRALVNFLYSMKCTPGLSQDDVLLAVTTISFDIAGLEIYLPLITGARVVLASKEETVDGERLLQKLNDSNVTIMQATPVSWRLLIAAGWEGNPPIKVLCGGEAFPRDLANQLASRGQSVWNMYGPTETTIWSTVCQIQQGEGNVSIGRPIANTQVYILDAHLQPTPIGVPGELYIGGDGVSRGYLNRPELNAERFVQDPFSRNPGKTFYRTGDVARYLPDGAIEFFGRIDHQVKIRGFRIELGEIEAELVASPAVKEAVVLVREDHPGDKRLVAYLIPAKESAPSVNMLRGTLQERLPDYMIPTLFVFLDAFPLTPNGKIDRRALPVPDEDRAEDVHVPPRTPIEQKLTEIWTETLGLERIGVHHNFFECGGHSLLATQVTFRIRQSFGVDLPVRALFESPTVAGLAEAIVAKQLEHVEDNALERILDEAERLSEEEVAQLLRNVTNA